ncbi:MAG: restriction endonuclease subunit S [Verrucomicrobiaceae bacterium]|nr:restriction endonuclease subunit S [Verrucomicrobiaceae bacterium]
MPEGLEPRPEIAVTAGDILVTRAGPSDRVGVVAYVRRTRPKIMLSDKLIRLRVKALHCPDFIARCLGSKQAQDQLKGQKSGLAKSQTNISQQGLLAVRLVTPTLPEQQKIAAFLTAVDGRIEQLSRKKALLEAYKKGVMQQLFTQTLRFQDDHDHDFPDWEEKTLGDFFTFKNGYNAEKDQYGKGTKFINVLDVLSSKPITHESILGRVDIPEKEFAKFEVTYGDILFQRSSETREEVGQANVYLDREHSAVFGGFVIRGKPIREFDPLFMNYLLRTPIARNEITSKSGGSTRYNVSQDTLAEARIVIPSSLPEQTKIAGFLSALDGKIGAVGEQMRQTQAWKKGLLQQMFV